MRKIYEWIDAGQRGIVTDWDLEVEQQAKLDNKLQMLRRAEVDAVTGRVSLPQNLLAGPGVYGQAAIYKLKVKGNVALRPMLSLGPIDLETEWTILAGAVERDRKLMPANAADVAEARRQEIRANPKRRRLLWDDDDDAVDKTT